MCFFYFVRILDECKNLNFQEDPFLYSTDGRRPLSFKELKAWGDNGDGLVMSHPLLLMEEIPNNHLGCMKPYK